MIPNIPIGTVGTELTREHLQAAAKRFATIQPEPLIGSAECPFVGSRSLLIGAEGEGWMEQVAPDIWIVLDVKPFAGTYWIAAS